MPGTGGLLARLFPPPRKRRYIVRMGIVGQPGAGAAGLLADLSHDRDPSGAGIHWQAEATHRLDALGTTEAPAALLEGTLRLQHPPGVSIPVQAIDMTSGLPDALATLDLLLLVVDPDLVFHDSSARLQAPLSEHVRVVLEHRSIASVCVLYTRADAYGLQYASMGRLLDAAHGSAIPSRLHLERRFPLPAERAVVEDVLRRTEPLWQSILRHEPQVPWQFNAYFVAGEPALPRTTHAVPRGASVHVAIDDFLDRVTQPWWPFWDAE